MTRERSRAYADGARQGAPDALQVADRVPLVQNRADALDQVLNAQSNTLEAVNAALRQAPVAQPDGTRAVPVPLPPRPRTAQELALHRQVRRPALPQQVWAFPQQGWPGGAMAHQLGMGQKTGCRDLRTPTWPERRRRTDRGRSLLTPSTSSRLERWHAGCRDALRLFRELQPRGSPGSDATVARYAPRVRQAQGQVPQRRPPRRPLPVVAEPAARHLTARRATWLVLRRPEQQDEDEATHLAQRKVQPPEVAAALVFAQDVAPLVREREPNHVEPWWARAAESPLVPFPRVAKGLRDDDDAVNAGVTWPWSHGPVEGQMKRLKRLTRQMFGRANRDLLPPRVLLAASGRYDGASSVAWRRHERGIGVPIGSLSPMRPG